MSYNNNYYSRIKLPKIIKTTNNIEGFLTSVYPTTDLYTALKDLDLLSSRAILSPRNNFVYKINNVLFNRTPSTAYTLYSINSCTFNDEDFADAADITPKFLNSINASGLPLLYLRVKVCPPY
jgi:hypothetical protein